MAINGEVNSSGMALTSGSHGMVKVEVAKLARPGELARSALN